MVIGVLPRSKVRRDVSIAKVFSFRHTVNPHHARAGLESIENNLTRGAQSDVMNSSNLRLVCLRERRGNVQREKFNLSDE